MPLKNKLPLHHLMEQELILFSEQKNAQWD
jgi:hypothetical protein